MGNLDNPSPIQQIIPLLCTCACRKGFQNCFSAICFLYQFYYIKSNNNSRSSRVIVSTDGLTSSTRAQIRLTFAVLTSCDISCHSPSWGDVYCIYCWSKSFCLPLPISFHSSHNDHPLSFCLPTLERFQPINKLIDCQKPK